MEPKYITFEQAKFFSSKELDIDCTSFYVKPNCKLFSVDEHGRHYSIKNTPKKLYKLGEHFVLKDENIFLAPEQHQVVDWLRVNHDIWVGVMPDVGMDLIYTYKIYSVEVGVERGLANGNNYDTPQEAYSAAFDYIKNNNLI